MLQFLLADVSIIETNPEVSPIFPRPSSSTSIWVLLIAAALSLVLACTTRGLEVTKIEFKLGEQPGSQTTHSFEVRHEGENPSEVSIRVADWYRNRTGGNVFVPKNTAKWVSKKSLSSGTTHELVYRIPLAEDSNLQKVQVEGTFSTSEPSLQGEVIGDSSINLKSGETGAAESDQEDLPVSVSRSIRLKGEGGTRHLRVTLNVQVNESVGGFQISEQFNHGVDVQPVKKDGASFHTVNRSCADWISVSPTQFTLDPGQSRKVQFELEVPTGVAGTYWAIIFVKGSPREIDREGTTIMAVKRFGVKVYETVPNTGRGEGYVTGFRTVTKSPPSFEVDFSNEGNTQLEVEGEVRLMDEAGSSVGTVNLDPVPVLPGYSRRITVSGEETKTLEPGKYQALAVFDYGGPNKVGARTSFTVEPLSLRPVGSSSKIPTDPDDDGLYEDINGDGELTRQDAIAFGFNFDSPAVLNNSRAFDFNLDGRINIQDAYKLRSLASPEGS